MVRKRDRVIGVLLVWVAILIGMALALERLTDLAVNDYNLWYGNFQVVTGANPEEANQALNGLQSLTNDLFFQTRQLGYSELFRYAPMILFIGATLLIGAMLSTLFIWRSVIVPETAIPPEEENALKAKHHFSSHRIGHEREVSAIVADDGELIEHLPDQAEARGKAR